MLDMAILMANIAKIQACALKNHGFDQYCPVPMYSYMCFAQINA